MRGKVGGFALGVLALSASGCASATFNSTVNWDHAPSAMARVFVIANMKNGAFNEDLYRGFEAGLRKEFTECGIKSEVMDAEANSRESLATARAQFQPDSMLVIREEGGHVYIGQYGNRNELRFDLMLFNARMNTPYWHADSGFKVVTENMFRYDIDSGKEFAREIVARLQADGVIKNCKMLEEDAKAEREEAARRAKEMSGFND